MTIEEAIRYYENKNVVLTEEEALANTIAIETMRKYEYDHNKIEKIAAILKTAKADPTRDEYAEFYLDKIEEVIRWKPI